MYITATAVAKLWENNQRVDFQEIETANIREGGFIYTTMMHEDILSGVHYDSLFLYWVIDKLYSIFTNMNNFSFDKIEHLLAKYLEIYVAILNYVKNKNFA